MLKVEIGIQTSIIGKNGDSIIFLGMFAGRQCVFGEQEVHWSCQNSLERVGEQSCCEYIVGGEDFSVKRMSHRGI